MKYALMFVGILAMCVPEDANMMQLVMQGTFGLAMFIRGVFLALEEEYI